MNHESYHSPTQILAMATKILLILATLGLFYHTDLDINAQSDNLNDTNSNNQIDDKKSYVIKYTLDGGFTGAHNFIWYNSTSNHLISNYKSNVSLYDLRLSEALFDTQLSYTQQKNLTDQIINGHLLNISFNNKEPDCCDIGYFRLEIKTASDVNSISWTSVNIWEDSNYQMIPSSVIKIVNTLTQYTTNSTILFSGSRIK